MSVKTIELTGIGQVTLVKRTGSRNLRLSVTSSGVRVSMPRWTSFNTGETFVRSHASWIQEELAKQSVARLESGQKIGKMHHLRFEHILSDQPATSRVTGTEIIVRLRSDESIGDASVQKRAQRASNRALKREAERLLPPRLQSLANKHNKYYKSISIKSLRRRWGSCDSHQAITLNLYLMELPWEQIDYVLMHELAHTQAMNHGPDFWQVLTTMEPRARVLSKQLRSRQPRIG